MAWVRAMLMAMVVARTSAVDHVVGDNKGWNPGVGYKAWAEGPDFHVGDSITFMYTQGEHNVIMVNATEFVSCAYSNATAEIWSSGFDVLPLAAPREHWYISGMEGDCSDGMKLAITVFAAEEPALAPMPGSPAPPSGASAAGELVVSPKKSCVWWVLAAMTAYWMVKA